MTHSPPQLTGRVFDVTVEPPLVERPVVHGDTDLVVLTVIREESVG